MCCVLDDIFMITLHQTLEKEASQYTPQLVTIVIGETMKAKSSNQINSLNCCSMTVRSRESDPNLVALVTSTEYPIIQADAQSRLDQEEQARVMVSQRNTHIESPLPQPKSSVATLVEKVRVGDFIQLLLEIFMNLVLVFQWLSSSGHILC